MTNMDRATVAIVGFGVMGKALSQNLVSQQLVRPEQLVVCDVDGARLQQAGRLGLNTAPAIAGAVVEAQTIMLCVKPQVMAEVLAAVPWGSSRSQLVVSIAAGVSTSTIEAAIGRPLPVVRAMPNLPLLVADGVIALAAGRFADQAALGLAHQLLGGSGRLVAVNEELMDAVTGFSGSGPAFAAVMLDALADAGVRVGFCRQQAVEMAAQVMLGTARLVLEGGMRPDQIRDDVASAGGTAIAGIHQLERCGVRGAIIDAVVAATRQSGRMGRAVARRDAAAERASRGGS